jgi:hypothetical protein
MRADWLQSVILIFALDLCKFNKALTLHYYLNWLWFRFGIRECNGEGGGDEHQGCEGLVGFE